MVHPHKNTLALGSDNNEISRTQVNRFQEDNYILQPHLIVLAQGAENTPSISDTR